MRLHTALLFLFSVLFACSFAEIDDGTDVDVTKLESSTFDDFVANDLTLVEFYAPWCGHCKSLFEPFKEAATVLKSKGVFLGKVDATKESSLASKYGVNGYPTLKIFRNGNPTDYQGPRSKEGIVEFMLKQVGPAVKPIEDLASALKVQEQDANKFLVLLLSTSVSSTSQIVSSFNILANRLRDDFSFGRLNVAGENDLISALGLGDLKKDTLVVIRGLIGASSSFQKVYDSTSSSTKEVETFIRSNVIADVDHYHAGNEKFYQERQKPLVKIFLPSATIKSNPKQLKYFTNRLEKVLKANDGILVAYADKKTYEQAWENFGFKNREYGIVLERLGTSKLYRFDEEGFNADKVAAWVGKVLDGQVDTYVKSEIAPVNNDGPVTIVTGSTFNKIVGDDDKDVLIEFYAPWCGHCKSLEPKYTELGTKLKANKNLVIAKIDATANDFDRDLYPVQGYPTIYFKPAGESKPLKYEGEREVAAMTEYLKKHATHELIGLPKKKKSKKAKSEL